ncbi:hypothetical protein VNI00_009393 [Paramarasmius palmivorus]|uniref:Uncharacterized protein n=1 Tax=Paramarasmius palmivorus TaxID=297713 RepID=A0AAW0CS79_9AGAR
MSSSDFHLDLVQVKHVDESTVDLTISSTNPVLDQLLEEPPPFITVYVDGSQLEKQPMVIRVQCLKGPARDKCPEKVTPSPEPPYKRNSMPPVKYHTNGLGPEDYSTDEDNGQFCVYATPSRPPRPPKDRARV